MSRKAEKKRALPEGWREVKLGNVCSVDEQTLSSKTPDDYCFMYVSLSDIEKGKLLQTKKYKFSDAPSRARRIVKQGDVLLATVRPNLQGFYIFKDKVKDFVVSTGFAVLTPKSHILDSMYLFQLLFSRKMLQTYDIVNVGSNYPAINSSDIPNFKILVPSFPEQKAIASLLETWDTAIEKTEALIEAKEKRFKWLLKTLISDQQGNPEWETTHLGSLCRIKKGEQLNKLHMIEMGKYPALNGGITPSGYTDKWNTPANTVTISEGGNSCGYVNHNTQDFWAGGHCYTLIDLAEGLDVNFLYYQLKEKEQSIMKLRVGSGLPNIQKGDMEKFTVILPSPPKQKHIANILNTSQREIDLFKQLAEQYHTQKRGLMQRLLTGQWRSNN